MNDLHIGELIIVGVDAEKALVASLFTEHTQVVTRGKYAMQWLESNGFGSRQTLQLSLTHGRGEKKWYEQIIEQFADADTASTLVYVTSLYTLGVDMVAQVLAQQAQTVRWVAGVNWLEEKLTESSFFRNGALQIVDILQFQDNLYPVFSPAMSVVLLTDGAEFDLLRLQQSLLQVYAADSVIHLLAGETHAAAAWNAITIEKLATLKETPAALYLPPLSADASLESFMQVIARLRAPDGCPWDRKQTHQSLRQYLLEETYEALDCLDRGDLEGLREELGDILLQIALHSQIAAESNEFTMSRVMQGINRKIVSRHPHIFSTAVVADEEGVIQNWEKIKQLERAGNSKNEENGVLSGVPPSLPALSQAQSIQERAARVGFDWPSIEPVVAKVLEEMQEVEEAQAEENSAAVAEELGDLFFAVVNLARWYKVDAETALRETNAKFRKRFAYIESQAEKGGRNLRDMTLEEMDTYWDEAKRRERE